MIKHFQTTALMDSIGTQGVMSCVFFMPFFDYHLTTCIGGYTNGQDL